MCAPPKTDAVTAAAVPHTRSAGKNGQSGRGDFRQPRQHLERVLSALGEAHPRIEDQAVAADACRPGGGHARHQLIPHLGNDVRVVRLGVHVRRPASVMHQDRRCAGARHHARHGRITGKRCDVVDDRRTARQSGFGHARLVGIDRDRDRHSTLQPFQHRQHPAQFLGFVNGRCPRPRRLAADIEDVGALLHHAERIRHRAGRIEALAAIGKRVGRDVDDRHDERARAKKEMTVAGQRHRHGRSWREHRDLMLGHGRNCVLLPRGRWQEVPRSARRPPAS